MSDRCYICGHKDTSFLWMGTMVWKCQICEKNYCSKCGKRNFDYNPIEPYLDDNSIIFASAICPNCIPKYEQEYDLYLKKIKEAKKEYDAIKIYSKNYQGKVDIIGSTKELTSEFYEDRDEAIKELKKRAAYLKYNTIKDVSFIKEKDSEETDNGETYYFTTWACKGVACNKKQK